MINKHIFIVALVLLCACQEKMAQGNLIREGDIPFAKRNWQAEYDPSFYPEIGKTTIEDLSNVYPNGPEFLITFDAEQNKNFEGFSFNFDAIYNYSDREYIEYSGSPSGYEAKEYIYFTYFFNSGTLQWYCVMHNVIGDNGNWAPGKYDTGVFGDRFHWPGAGVDIRKYWDQYTEDDRKRIFRENNYIDLYEYFPREHPD